MKKTIVCALLCLAGCNFPSGSLSHKEALSPLTGVPHPAFVIDEWLKAKVLKEYQEHGNTNPVWDASARVLIGEMMIQPDEDSLPSERYIRAWRLSGELQQKGCTDPLFTYFYGKLISDFRGPAAARPAMETALSGMISNHYSPFLIAYAREGVAFTFNSVEHIQPYVGPINSDLIAAATDPDFTNGGQRVYLQHLYPFFDTWWWPDAEKARLVQALTLNPQVDPWLKNMVVGTDHLKKAWKSRGFGWASQVTPEGWKGFQKELDLARAAFTNAWALHPDYPESACQMIEVCAVTCNDTAARLWLNRAVGAEFDYIPAYQKYLFYLQPKWGGSHDQIYAFGKQCLDTKRFDTAVPDLYLESVRMIAAESRDPVDCYKRPGLADDMRTYYTAKLGRLTNAKKIRSVQSEYAVTLWACGKYTEAQSLFSKLGPDLSREAFGPFQRTSRQVLTDLKVRTSNSQILLNQADKLRQVREAEDAAWSKNLEDSIPNKAGTPFVPFAVSIPGCTGTLDEKELAAALQDLDRQVEQFKAKNGITAIPPDSALDTEMRLAKLNVLFHAEMSVDFNIKLLEQTILPLIHSTRHIGRVLDFATATVPEVYPRAPGFMMNFAWYFHSDCLFPRDHDTNKITRIMSELEKIPTTPALREACWKAYWEDGTPVLTLQMARLLRTRNLEDIASVFEDRVFSWFQVYCKLSPDKWAAWQCMSTLDQVEGYEEDVVDYGLRANQMGLTDTASLCVARALVRLGKLDAAAEVFGRIKNGAKDFGGQNKNARYQATEEEIRGVFDLIYRDPRTSFSSKKDMDALFLEDFSKKQVLLDLETNETLGTQMAQPGLDDSTWPEMEVGIPWEKAALPLFDGLVWLRKAVEIPAAWAGKDLILHLGPVDEIDVTWFNAVRIGGMGSCKDDVVKYWDYPRVYKVPGSAVKAGRAVLTVRVIDTVYAGGIWGANPKDMILAPADGSDPQGVSVSGKWKYQVGQKL